MNNFCCQICNNRLSIPADGDDGKQKMVNILKPDSDKCKLCGSILNTNYHMLSGYMCIANNHYSLYDTEETFRFHGYYARHSLASGEWRIYCNFNTSKLYSNNDYYDSNRLLTLVEFDYNLFSTLSSDEQDVYIQKLIMLQ
jgi:hypothetical protein